MKEYIKAGFGVTIGIALATGVTGVIKNIAHILCEGKKPEKETEPEEITEDE